MLEPSDELFTTPEMAAVFSSAAHVRQMLVFEVALARAEAQVGLIPWEAAEAIAAASQVEQFDVAALYREAGTAGTPAIPLVRMLTEYVAEEAREFVHWGATSQDVIDTALVLQMREGLNLLLADLWQLCAGCATLAEQHRHTVMAGRTLLQQALPITFGLKAARWLALAMRQVHTLSAHHEQTLVLQFGGAAGTLAALNNAGLLVAERLAEELRLPLPDLPWHTERDRIATVAGALGVTAGAMAKIAGDIVLLAQTEVGEAAEAVAPGKGVSSTLPQKRNPVDAVGAMAAARLAIGVMPVILAALAQEHERSVGGWQAEWKAIPDLFRYTAGAVARVQQAVAGLQIDPDRMRANLELSGGVLMAESLTMALTPHIGRQEARHIVQALSLEALSTGHTLHEAAHNEAQISAILSADAINQALDPARYLGSTDALIDRALASYRKG